MLHRSPYFGYIALLSTLFSPLIVRGNVGYGVSLRVADLEFPQADSNDWPFKVYKGRRYSITLRPDPAAAQATTTTTSEWTAATDADLRVSPDECYLSEHSDPKKARYRHMLLKDNCPMDRTVEIIHGMEAGNRVTQLSFRVTTARYFRKEILWLFIHCDVFFCSLSGNRHSQGFVDCPNPNYCAVEARVLTENAIPVVNQVRVHALSGPIRPLIPKKGLFPNSRVPNMDCDCSSMRAVIEMTTTASSARREQRIVQVFEGMPFWEVVLLAFISFLIGAATVTFLWFIRNSTEPVRNRCPEGKRRNANSDSHTSSLDSRSHLATAHFCQPQTAFIDINCPS